MTRRDHPKPIKGVGNSAGMRALTSGLSWDFPTPDDLFDALDAECGPFTLDPATALGYHTSDVILGRGGRIVTLDGAYEAVAHNGEDFYGTFLVEDEDGAPLPGDGLAHSWTGRVWLNHPYGREDWRWMKKAHDSVRHGDAEIVVALVPVKTQMKWWHKYVGATEIYRFVQSRNTGGNDNALVYSPLESARATGADVIRFVRGRLRFGGAPSSAPFNSAVIVWRK